MNSEITIKIALPPSPGEGAKVSIDGTTSIDGRMGDVRGQLGLPRPSDDVGMDEDSYPIPSDEKSRGFSGQKKESWMDNEPLEDLEDEGRPFGRRL